jgi:hypothetical protein
VQFLVDGLPFGSVVLNAPYVLAWGTRTTVNGSHWLLAQVTDSSGRIGTSPVLLVTVLNVNTTPPTVQITSPDAGSTVNAVTSVAATAAAQTGYPIVQFYVDGMRLGSPVAAPLYLTFWNTQTFAPGTHMLTASAVDSAGAGASPGYMVKLSPHQAPWLLRLIRCKHDQ